MTILKRVFVLGLVYAISLSIPLESRYGTVWADGEIGELDMVYISGGEVLIGDHSTIRDPANPIGWGEERPVHAVYINSFYIGRGEMTNQEYCDFLNHADVKVVVGSAHGDIVYAASDDSNSRPYTPVSPLGADSMIAYNDGDGTFSLRTREGQEMGDFPIVEVSWYGAAAYCNWRSAYEGYEPCYNLSTLTLEWECDFSKNGYRLPTEHEWEFAARGGLHDPYYDYPWASNSIDFSKANYGNINNQPLNNPRGWSIHPYLTKAGDYPVNGYVLYDMAGNTWEWCNDWYSYQYNNVPYDNPTGPAISPYGHRVVRGSCWQRSGFYCRVSCRTGSGFVPDFMDNRMGFRIARPYSGSNTRPGLTFVGLLTGAEPDQDYTISYAVLAAASNAQDADDDPISFRVESVPDGELKKNGGEVIPGSTLLGVGESLVWTPPTGITGILAAFTTKAWDELETSATAVTVPVQVATGSNTPPLLTQVNILTGAEPDQDFTISYDILAAAADEIDGDDDPISFRIESVTNGVLKKNGVEVIPGTTLLGIGEELIWSPPPGVFGILEAFSLKVWDGLDTNATAVPVRITVGSNTPPTLTQVEVISGAIQDQDFTISYATLSAAADEADMDGDAISFRVESVTNGVLKKNGVAVTPGITLLGIGEELVWSPPGGTLETLEAFTVKAWDGLNVSTTAIPVSVVVDSGELLPQSIPYIEYFSSGLPGAAAGWEYYSTAEGRIAVEEGMLRMDDDTVSNPPVKSLNEAILHLDLAGAKNVTLTLDHVNSIEIGQGDENDPLSTQSSFTGHANGDGISFSNDGINWYLLKSLTTSFTGQRFDLDAAVKARGIVYTSAFQLKFQQYDNASWPDDGRAFDNILISSGPSNQIGLPDLTCFFADNSLPSSIVAGSAAKGKVQIYVFNQGIGPVRRNQKFDARILARPEEATDDQNDIVLTASENLSVGHLKPGKYKKLKFSVSIPEDFPKDDYYLIVEIDTLNYIEELEENNNTVMTSNTFSVWDPFWDMEADIDDGAKLPVSVISGDGTKITLPVSVKNIGNVRLPSEQSISILVVARPAAHLETFEFDVFLDSFDNINISNLKPDKYKKQNFQVYLPLGMTTEDYVLLVWVDSAEQVVEKEETNNIDVTFPFGVLTGFIDLTAQFGESTLPLEVVVGQEVKAKIPVIVTNEGNVSVARGRKINIRLIAHPLAGGDYVELLPADKQILSVNNLKPGKSKKLNATVIIPADLPPGDYEILTIIDSQNDVEEDNENNNIIVYNNIVSVNP